MTFQETFTSKEEVNFKNELGNLKGTIENKEIAPKITADFELLNGSNMPKGVNRYRIVKKSINGNNVNGLDVMGNFFECTTGNIKLELGVNGSTINQLKTNNNGKNNTALIMPLPFINGSGKTEGITISNGTLDTSEVLNYRGDNALVYFKDGKTGIVKVKIGDNKQSKERLNNPTITATNNNESNLLEEILDPNNGYTVCQQFSIMDNGIRSCNFVGQSTNNKKEGGGRRYRFFVETNKGTTGVVDFKEDITINQAINIMSQNGIKNAVYADIIAYNINFGDTNGDFYTRQEGSAGESSYKKLEQNKLSEPLTNKNNLIITGE